MSIKVNSIGLKGLEGYLVKADVKVLDGIDVFTIVGLPDASGWTRGQGFCPKEQHIKRMGG